MFAKNLRLYGCAAIAGLFLGSVCLAGYYEDAYKAYSENNLDEAIKILEEGAAAAPNDEQLQHLLGQTYFKKKQYDKAIESLKKTIMLAPEIDAAHFLLGYCYTLRDPKTDKKPDWFEASNSFAKAVELKPDKFNYLSNYGHALLELKKYTQALAPLKQAFDTEEGSKDYKTAMDYGIALQANKQTEEAIKLLEKAAELNPEKYQPLVYLGNLYIDMNQYEALKSLSEKLIALQPDVGRGYTFRGIGQIQTKDYAAAETSFRKAIELDPQDATAYYNLGLALDGKGAGNQEMIDAFAKAINLSGSNVPGDWYYRLGLAYEKEAGIDKERAIRNDESRARCLRNLNKAREFYTKAGDNASAKRQLGSVNEQIRNLETIR